MPRAVVSRPLVGLSTRRSQIPLEHVDVRADITGAHVRVTCTQRYRNQEPQPVEAVYVFPLDEGAANKWRTQLRRDERCAVSGRSGSRGHDAMVPQSLLTFDPTIHPG